MKNKENKSFLVLAAQEEGGGFLLVFTEREGLVGWPEPTSRRRCQRALARPGQRLTSASRDTPVTASLTEDPGKDVRG